MEGELRNPSGDDRSSTVEGVTELQTPTTTGVFDFPSLDDEDTNDNGNSSTPSRPCRNPRRNSRRNGKKRKRSNDGSNNSNKK